MSLQLTKKFHSYTTSFSEDKLYSRQYVGKPKFSSAAELGNDMKLNQGCHHFLSFVFGVNVCFVFGFVIFNHNADIC